MNKAVSNGGCFRSITSEYFLKSQPKEATLPCNIYAMLIVYLDFIPGYRLYYSAGNFPSQFGMHVRITERAQPVLKLDTFLKEISRSSDDYLNWSIGKMLAYWIAFDIEYDLK